MLRLTACLCALALPATAQTAAAPVSIELNRLTPADGGCMLTFVVANSQPGDIDSAIWEAVLFDTTGQVDRLTLFDFGALPAGRPRVRQFVVPDLGCGNLGQVLFNGLNECAAPLGTQCDDGLDLRSRTSARVSG